MIVLNDDHNTFEGVAAALSRVLPGVSYDHGMAMANRIHNTGQADSARDGEERFIARLESDMHDATDPATVEAFEQAAPPDQLYQGLARYWRKRAE